MDCSRFGLCIDSLSANNQKLVNCSETECLKSYDARKSVVVEENKKKYELINSKFDKIANFHIDGGMLSTNSTVRCDNLLVDIDSQVAIFVELKGTDLRHALEQVYATVMLLSQDLAQYQTYARIVTSSKTNVPNIKACPQYVRLNKKIREKRGNIDIHTNIISENVAGLV